ncbi:hypothetical protein COCHEDRAFT_1019453, partial [Bipolaris maydis C5]
MRREREKEICAKDRQERQTTKRNNAIPPKRKKRVGNGVINGERSNAVEGLALRSKKSGGGNAALYK